MTDEDAIITPADRALFQELERFVFQGYGGPGLDEECLDVIARYRLVIQTACAEREAAMVAEIAKLRKALKPFAGIVAGDGDDFSTWRSEVVIRCEVTVGEIHEARAALKGSDQ